MAIQHETSDKRSDGLDRTYAFPRAQVIPQYGSHWNEMHRSVRYVSKVGCMFRSKGLRKWETRSIQTKERGRREGKEGKRLHIQAHIYKTLNSNAYHAIHTDYSIISVLECVAFECEMYIYLQHSKSSYSSCYKWVKGTAKWHILLLNINCLNTIASGWLRRRRVCVRKRGKTKQGNSLQAKRSAAKMLKTPKRIGDQNHAKIESTWDITSNFSHN